MEESQPKVSLLKFYVKDLSFETFYGAQIFLEKPEQWNPDIDLQLGNKVTALKDGIHEIVLDMTVTAKLKDKAVFLVEVQMAGIFNIQGADQPRVAEVIGGPCLQMLFPYAREVVSDLVMRGGFPQLLLAPVSFANLYRQHLAEVKSAQEKEDNT